MDKLYCRTTAPTKYVIFVGLKQEQKKYVVGGEFMKRRRRREKHTKKRSITKANANEMQQKIF